MAARGRTGGGGGRPLGRELFEQNRRERLAREGPQRPPSERHDELQRDGQALAQQLAERLSPAQRAALESRTPAATPDEAVRERCEALLTMNREALSARGESGQTTSQAFLQRCHQFSRETFECADRGEEGREDPACRTHLQRLDREVGTLRRQGDEVRNPEQRIDSLAGEQWETEREAVAPPSLAAESVLD